MSAVAGPGLTCLRTASPLAKLALGVFAVALGLLSWRLWPEWWHNPDLSHGLFMPAVFLLLIHDSRTSGTRRFIQSGLIFGIALFLLILSSLFALGSAGLFAAALGWSHALVNFMLTTACVLMLGAGLVALADRSVRLISFNWPAWVAVALWMLSTPMPHGTYSRLTLAFQLSVSENVLRTLHLVGVAALRHGNVIQLAQTSVGIEEACSGVRSLISCVFAGLFFSATLVRRPWARALLIGLSVPLALTMNFIRSLALTLLANRGVNIEGSWHDVTGFAVLGVTAALLAGLALLLERRERKPAATIAAEADTPARYSDSTTGNFRLKTLIVGQAAAMALVGLFVINTHPSIRPDAPVPNLYSILPSSSSGWEVETTNDLFQFSNVLQTDLLAQRTYLKRKPNGEQIQVTFYAAYWRAGQTSVSQVASHTPDACWPGAGWDAVPTPPPGAPPQIGGRTLPAAEYRFFKSQEFPQHVWFWHLFDGRPIAYRDPYSASALLRIAWQYGFRHDGDQLFVRISSNVPWSEIAAEPLLAQFFARTQPLGL